MKKKIADSQPKQYVLIYLFLLVLTLVTYKNAFHDSFSLDDSFIYNNLPEETNFSDCFTVFTKAYNRIDYRPLVMFTYALEQSFWGEINPLYSHIINVILYSFVGFIVFLIGIKIGINEKYKIGFALLFSIFFIVHPVHANIVNSIKNRDVILSLLFGLSSLFFVLKYFKNNKITNVIIAVFLLVLGLMSKKDAILIVPLAFLIFLFQHQFRFRFQKKFIRPLLLIAGVFIISNIILKIIIQSNDVDIQSIPLSEAILTTENPLSEFSSFSERLSLSIATLFQYVKFMIIPKDYFFYFGYNMIELIPLWSLTTLVKFIILLSFLLVGIISYRKIPLLLLGILGFYACLVPFANLLAPVGGILAPRYAAFASISFCLVLTVLSFSLFEYTNDLSKKLPKKSTFKNIRLAPYLLIAILILGIYIPNTWSRSKDWKNIRTLLDADMPHLQKSYEANRIAATEYIEYALSNPNLPPLQKRKEYEQGLKYALQANSTYDKQLHVNESIGLAYYGLGDIGKAEKQLYKVFAEYDTSMISLELLGDINFSKSNLDSSIFYYSKFIELDPYYNVVQRKLTNALISSGQVERAKQANKLLIEQNPRNYIPYENLSYVYLFEQDTIKAMDHYLKAFQYGLRDRNMAYNIRNLYLSYGLTDEARYMEQFMK